MRSTPTELLVSLLASLAMCTPLAAEEKLTEKFTPAQQTAVAEVESRAKELAEVNRSLWTWAEVGLKEHRSSALLIDKLQSAGFAVKKGVSGMPTAFVAEYGSGKPVIGILAEYDALPELSQEVSPDARARDAGRGRARLRALGPGHRGASGAALAVKEAYEKHKLKGTIRVYGTPAEETRHRQGVHGAGRPVRRPRRLPALAPRRGQPVPGTAARKAVISAKFTFDGPAAHAAGSPETGRSALDGVELMNVGANYMREHVKEDDPHPLRHHQRRRPAERGAGDGPGLVLRPGQRRTRTWSATSTG